MKILMEKVDQLISQQINGQSPMVKPSVRWIIMIFLKKNMEFLKRFQDMTSCKLWENTIKNKKLRIKNTCT